MSGPEPTIPLDAIRTTQFGQMIAVCDAFEADWREGRRPRIEDVLETVPAVERPALLFELLALERELRTRAGEIPDRREYRDRFPDQAAVVDAAFATALPTVSAGGSSLPAPPGYVILGELGRGGM